MLSSAGRGEISMKKASGRAAGDILSIFHALAISCESAMARACSQDFSLMLSEMGFNIETAMPRELLRSAAKKETVEELAFLLTDFLMPSGRFGALEFSTDGDGSYRLSVSDCGFARGELHRRFKTKSVICPMALLYAAFLAKAARNIGTVSIRPSDFTQRSSTTRMVLTNMSDDAGRSESLRFSSASSEYMLDRMDLEIIRIIQGNARLSNVEIAAALKTSEATVRRRIQAMTERGVIKGFMAKIDHSRLRKKVRVHLALEVSQKEIDSVANTLLGRPELCSLYRSIGKYNLICELLMDDMQSVQNLVDEISRTKGVLSANTMIATAPLKPCPWYD